MDTYTVHIDNNNWFSVDSKVIEFEKQTVRLVNLRSIKGFIGESFDLSDNKLKELIKRYLIYSSNVELLNIYSRKYNGHNWFEIYTSQENSEKQAENHHGVITPCSKLDQFYELSDYIQISNEFDDSKFMNNLKGSNGLLIPSKLYEKMNPQLPMFQKIDINSVKFIPLWYINGSLRSRAEFTELYTTFEILIHILSKRFITFKSELLSISSTEIQLSEAKGYTVSDYLKLEKDSLAELLIQKDKKIDDFNKLMKEVREEMRDLKLTINNQSNKISDLKQSNDSLNSEIIGLKDLNRDLKQSNDSLTSEITGLRVSNIDLKQSNDSLTSEIAGFKASNDSLTYEVQDLKSRLNNVAENVSIISSTVVDNQNEMGYHLNRCLPDNYILTGCTDEVFILINRLSLNKEIREKFKGLGSDYIILDSVSCQLRDRESNLNKHKYNKKEDKIVFESDHGNSLDFNKFVQNHKDIIRPLNDVVDTDGKYIRKFIIKETKLEELTKELTKIVGESNNPKDELMTINKNSAETIANPLSKILESIQEVKIENEKSKLEIKDQITKLHEKVDSNHQEIKNELEVIKNRYVTKEILEKIFKCLPNQIYFNHRYRDFIFLANGRIKFATRMEKGEIIEYEYLTLDILKNAVFRFNKNVYKPDSKRNNLIKNEEIINLCIIDE